MRCASDPPLYGAGQRLSDLQDQNVIQTTLHNQIIRVLLVDDHTLVRQGIRALLENYSDLLGDGRSRRRRRGHYHGRPIGPECRADGYQHAMTWTASRRPSASSRIGQKSK